MSKVQWNVSNADEKIEELSDDELPKDPPGYVPSAPEREPETPELDMLAVGNEASEELSEDEQEAEDIAILANARLRLERGRLYELLMINDIFTNMDADPQAVKSVQREVRKFAQERMEIMLGIKQPSQQVGVVSSPFNSLEVQVLKTLAAKLSGGDTQKVEGPQPPPKSKTITPISAGSGKTTKAVVKAAAAKAIQAKSSAKEVPAVDPNLASKKIGEMTYDEKLEYNRQKSALYESRKVANPEALAMPSIEGANSIYASKALTIGQITSNLKPR